MADQTLQQIQKRTIRFLVIGQVMSGFGLGATFSMGSLIAEYLSGTAALSGSAATFSTLGTAILALPLSYLAGIKGRRIALATGAMLAIFGAVLIITAAAVGSFGLFICAVFLAGAGGAAGLQARFAAVDLPSNRSSAKDLSLVVWATTLGAIVSPNLFEPGQAIGDALGMPLYTGPFLLMISGQILATLVFWFGLRPDPLLHAASLGKNPTNTRPSITANFKAGFRELRRNTIARYAVFTIALSHMVMVGIMSMTPVHMKGMDFGLVLIGFTISLHVAGMFAFSPIFGWLADRIGHLRVIYIGQVITLAALAFAGLGEHDMTYIAIGLLLLGLGWSASTVAASALLSTSVPSETKTNIQGMSDSLMSLSGALGGAIAGAILSTVAYPGLNAVALLPVVMVLLITTRQQIKKTA